MGLKAQSRGLVLSGWVPFAIVVFAFIGVVHISAAVSFDDAFRFVGYLGVWITFPGTVIWRLVDPRASRRPLAEDLAIGSLVGYVVESGVYLACLAAGHPHGYLLWPVVPLLMLFTPLCRRVRHLGDGKMPLWWSWSAGVAALYLIAWFGNHLWRINSILPYALRRPYVDQPFHLALISGLKHFFPPRVTYVADTPLNYHYLSHVHMAAASWVTGVEPIVLLRALAMPALILIAIFAAAQVVVRLTGTAWVGLVLFATIAVTAPNFTGTGSAGLLSTLLINSPSAAFVNAAMLLGLLLCMELLTLPQRAYAATALAFVTFVAMSGAKSTSLATVLGGLAIATLVSSIAARKINVRAVVLTGLAGIGFLVAKQIFFGPGSHGLAVDPLAASTLKLLEFPGLGDATGQMSFGVRALVATFILAYLSLGAAALALLSRRGWANPSHLFLVGTCVSGIGAGLAFHQSGFSEFYFIYVVALPMMVAASLGVHHLATDRPPSRVVKLGVSALVVGAVGASAFRTFSPTVPHHPDGSPVSQALEFFTLPALGWLGLAGLLTGLVLIGRRIVEHRAPRSTGAALLVTVIVFAGLGVGSFERDQFPDILSDPIPRPAPATTGNLIDAGGIDAARWLRAHSPIDDLVATNRHCQHAHGVCVARNFWMAGYSERQFLVEGWSYVSRTSVGLHPPADENVTMGPFWDPKRLAANDDAFAHPTPTNLAYLAHHYGVRWLFVAPGAPADLAALKAYADLRYDNQNFQIFRLR
jgi:hypothetical protein